MAGKRKFSKYGLDWDIDLSPLEVEFYFIRRGGYYKYGGRTYGEGLFHHYRAAEKLLWPSHDQHRWGDLVLKEILENTITGVMGPASSCKTFSASKYALIDYWAFPNDTLFLVSSTDVRGLELRVWGTIKDLFNQAKERFEDLPGKVLDSLHTITTDDFDKSENRARTLKKGIICVPCLQSGRYVGLGKYVGIKQKRLRLIADECFPSGTMVNTPLGPVSIETLRVGDEVISANGIGKVVATSSRIAYDLITVHAKDGREFSCTRKHPILTQKGWIYACELNQSHYMVGQDESLQILCDPNSEHFFLQQALRREIRDTQSSQSKEILLSSASGQNRRIEGCNVSGEARASETVFGQNEIRKSNGYRIQQAKGCCNIEKNGVEAFNSRRQRHRANQTGNTTLENGSASSLELSHCNQNASGKRISDLLQSGSGTAAHQTGDRSRWGQPRPVEPEITGRKEGQVLEGSWVDRIEIFQQADNGFQNTNSNSGGNRVHNLHITDHPSYSVEGFLVHNCQLMGSSFLDGISNLSSNPGFKGVLLGNPIDPLDPLGLACEPIGGWGSMPEPVKTAVWKTRFLNGKCINLVGTDSPNFDYPQDEPPRYPYMVNQRRLDEIAAFWTKDSQQYYSQGVGVMKTGLLTKRVITRAMCEQHHAFRKAEWLNADRTKVYALDAAYSGVGGDRCVGGWIEFGKGAHGGDILRVNPPKIIPIVINIGREPEDQIAEYIQKDILAEGIPPKQVFYDSTGRGTLGSSFARLFMAETPVPVEFGGKPSNRPVRHDLFIDDNGTERHKRCDEHYYDFVSELWFSVRYIIESEQLRELPEDVMREGCAREYGRSKGNKFFIESKHDPKARQRMVRSPDLFDWLATAIEGARRLGFRIARLGASFTEDNADDDYWQREQKAYQDEISSHLLIH